MDPNTQQAILQVIGNLWVVVGGTVAICAILATIAEWNINEKR